MKCATCGFENASDAVFCVECGTMLAPAAPGPEEVPVLYCTQCGAENPATAEVCRHCSYSLDDAHAVLAGPLSERREAALARPVVEAAEPALPPSAVAGKRPGCVTVYAILQGIGAVSVGIGGVLLMQGDTPTAIGALTVVGGGLLGILAVGLWQMKNWARILLLILQGLGLAAGVLSFVLTAGGPGGYEVVMVIVQLAVSAVIFYWFASHGEYFH